MLSTVIVKCLVLIKVSINRLICCFLHRPEPQSRRKSRLVRELRQLGIDPDNMDVYPDDIESLAPFYEKGNKYFPYCTSYLKPFCVLIRQFLHGRQTFCGKDTIGVCPGGTRVGHLICKVTGLNIALVLERGQSAERYVLVGPCQIITPRSQKISSCKSNSFHLDLPAQ
jgi:hypothetical protein